MNKDYDLNCRNSNISANSKILDKLKPQKLTGKKISLLTFFCLRKLSLKHKTKPKQNT